MIQSRDTTIDTLRGLAIFTMVAANMAPGVLAEPHPFWFRIYGTFAAPLFILISGMMVTLTSKTKDHTLKYFFVRGVIIMIVGALIDVLIWKIYPFTSFDVLYLIGISIPLAYLSIRLNTLSRWVIVIFIFVFTPFLQKILGYTDYPTEFYLWGGQTIMVANQTKIFNHWLIDGWFPLFPWLGFSLLGVNLALLRWKSQSHTTFGKSAIFLIGISILFFGSIIWKFYPESLLIRDGYSELFYPPTIGYVLSSIGLIVILFSVVDRRPSVTLYKPLQALGNSALFMYILHLALIEYIISPIWSEENLQTFLVIYIALLFSLLVIAYGLRILKTYWRKKPFLVRFLLGS